MLDLASKVINLYTQADLTCAYLESIIDTAGIVLQSCSISKHYLHGALADHKITCMTMTHY